LACSETTAIRNSPYPGLDAAPVSRQTGPNAEGANSITQRETKQGAGRAPVLSLLFESGARPKAADVIVLGVRSGAFSVSNKPADDGAGGVTWLELLTNGLTFDLQRLAPSEPRVIDGFMNRFDLPGSFDIGRCEAVTLEPGPHLEGGANLLPVTRSQMALAVELCALPGIVAVGWGPARSLSSPAHFTSSVTRWLEGGVFPGLGLTALAEQEDGGMRSEGLAFFTGQDIDIGPEVAKDKAGTAKLALRLIHEMVEAGGIAEPERVTGPEGEALLLEPIDKGQVVKVTKA
jgi:hypothetical protein